MKYKGLPVDSFLMCENVRLKKMRDLLGSKCSDLTRALDFLSTYLTWSPTGQDNSVHAMNLFFIFSEQPNKELQ